MAGSAGEFALVLLEQRVQDLMKDNNDLLAKMQDCKEDNDDLKAQNHMLRQELQEARESAMNFESERLEHIFEVVSNADLTRLDQTAGEILSSKQKITSCCRML